jgi:hypothetical protein
MLLFQAILIHTDYTHPTSIVKSSVKIGLAAATLGCYQHLLAVSIDHFSFCCSRYHLAESLSFKGSKPGYILLTGESSVTQFGCTIIVHNSGPTLKKKFGMGDIYRYFI